MKILIIEDSPVDARLLQSMLQDTNPMPEVVDTVKTVGDALVLIEKNKYDTVILDLNLPDSEGVATVKKISCTFPALPVVVNTAEHEEAIGVASVAAGAEDFLVKGKYTAYILNKTLYYAIERKRIEVELKDAYRKLKETQNHLIDAEKMKVVGGLASGIAHEVKNPLATILYAATYLEEHVKSDNKNYMTVLKNIKESAQRADNIIKDLLDFAAVREVDKEVVDLTNLIDKALNLIIFQFEKKQIKVYKEYEKNLARVAVDANRINQVFLNVFLNAQYALQSNGELRIKVFNSTVKAVKEKYLVDVKDVSNDVAVVVVQFIDNGCGISQEKIKNIFEPFYTTRRANGGVGLGLSVVKNIMDRHGAFVAISNNLSRGVTVNLIFQTAK